MAVLCHFMTDPPLTSDTTVVEVMGGQRLSTLFTFQVRVAERVEVEPYVGARARIVLEDRDQGYERCMDGLVTCVQRRARREDDHTLFTIQPELAILTQRHNHRIFQKKTAKQIIEEVLQQARVYVGLVDWRLSRPDLRERDYCTQYHESDYNFISRLLEEEGIVFTFEHPTTEAEVGSERLVFLDSVDLCRHLEGETILYNDAEHGHEPGQEHVYRVQLASSVVPNESMVRDYNYVNPTLRGMEGRALAVEDNAAGNRERRVYVYPAGYETLEQGTELARRRLESHRTQGTLAEGDTNSIRLDPGLVFTLTDGPDPEFDRSYCVWTVHLDVRPAESSDGGYHCRFEAAPTNLPLRPLLLTQKPRVVGSQTAFVVGPKGEEVDPTNLGQVRVQFHWDREGKDDQNSSCWIRVAQTWAGDGFGSMIIPRIGMEVVVSFLEGDPDRPLITGCVYNGTHLPPYNLPEHKTRSAFKTRSSPNGEADEFNELTFEDLKGEEFIYMHAQKDFNEEILHDHTSKIDNNESITVKRSHSISAGTISHSAGGNHNESAGGDHNRSADVNINDSAGVCANREAKVNINDTAGSNIYQTATNVLSQESANQIINTGGCWATVENQFQIAGPRFNTFNDDIVLKGSTSVTVKGGTVAVEGTDVTVYGASSIGISGGPITIATADSVNISGGGPVTVVGSDVSVSGGTVALTGGVVKLNS